MVDRVSNSGGLRNRLNTGVFTDDSSNVIPSPSPYGRPVSTHRNVDKSSALWRDFLNGARKRKKKLSKICEVAMEESTSHQLLKKMMLDLRQSTLRVIEDALEIEYRYELGHANDIRSLQRSNSGSLSKLPPLTSYPGMDEKEDIFILSDIISDVDELLRVQGIKAMLPSDFPFSRNPFLVGKSIDDLAMLEAPQPQPGNLEEELKVLELLRFKRAAKALLRAEAQVCNRTPLELRDLDRLWTRIGENIALSKLIRAVMTLLDNDNSEITTSDAVLTHIKAAHVLVDSHEFLMRLSAFKGDQAMRPDVQAAVRKFLSDFSVDLLDGDVTSIYLVEWVNRVIGAASRIQQGPSSSSLGRPVSGRASRAGTPSSDLAAVLTSHSGYAMDDFHSDKKAPLMKVQHKRAPTDVAFSRVAHSLGAEALRRRVPQREVPVIADSKSSTAPVLPDVDLADSDLPKSQQGDRRRADINRMVMEEVARTMREAELRANAKKVVGASIAAGPPDPSKKNVDKLESETLSSVRYELLKIQQELLRRQVLDPRYYNATSVDVVNVEKKGAVESPAETKRYVPICEQEVEFRDGSQGLIEVLHDLLADNMLTRLLRLVHLDHLGNEIDPLRLASGEDIVAKVGREAFAFMRISKLIVNRLTNVTFDVVIKESIPAMKLKHLEAIMFQLKGHANELPPPRGRLTVQADRTLFFTQLASNGVAANLLICRNEECSGLLLICTPLSNSSARNPLDTGPITVTINDKELQVLLVNQRSLFLLAQTKWSCMEMVAQWLASRITIRKIKLFDNETSDFASLKRSLNIQAKATGDKSRSASPFSSLPMQNKAEQPVSGSGSKLDKEDADALRSEGGVTVETDELSSTDGMTRPGSTSISIKSSRQDDSPMLLDLKLDRRVEIAKTASSQWKHRNVPVIAGMTIKLRAVQDLELLRFQCTISIPHPRLRKDISSSANRLIDFSKVDEDEEAPEEFFNVANAKPIEVVTTFQLTANELVIFGAAESIEERHISLSNATTTNDHPSTFVWNILSRLHLDFKGSVAYPYSPECNAEKPENWNLRYDRRLLRDIRTISGGVVIMTASAVGAEILYEAEPTDGSIFDKVGPKLMQEREILELIQSEGWPLSLLETNYRTRLAYRILDKLKVVHENSKFRLEPNSYAETRLLEVVRAVALNRPDVSLGSVEINSHHSLTDLRAIILHELDKDTIPRQYRFLYKGSACSVRQEGFRKAWECWPKVVLVGKVPKLAARDGGYDGGERDIREPSSKPSKGSEAVEVNDEGKIVHADGTVSSPRNEKLEKGQRRVSKKLVPVPVPTLCYVREGSDNVYLMHDGRGMVMAGDVIRIGDVRGRDYIVAIRSRALQTSFPKTLKIQPEFNMKLETEFERLIQGAMPYPNNAGQFRTKRVLPNPIALGFKYELPVENDDDKTTKKAKGKPKDLDAAELDDTLGNKTVLVAKQAELGKIWTEVWLWKCIPPSEDNRPKWRKLYDNGQVRYSYDYADSREFVQHFRVKAPLSYLEVLCTDCRCPDMSLFSQRVHEMYNLSTAYFVEMAFNSMCDWYPQFKRGIDSLKYIKFVRDAKIFPDIKEPSRMSQIDLLFQKELKGENSLVEKYVTFKGFQNLLYRLAMIRFPPSLFAKDEDAKDDGSLNADDMRSLASSMGDGGSQGIPMPKQPRLLNVKSVAHQKEMTKPKKAESAAKMTEEVTDDPEYLEFVLSKFVNEYISAYPAWADTPWNESKLVVMKKEAVRYCAATRIASKFRANVWKHKYSFFRAKMLVLQAHMRRRLIQNRTRQLVRMLVEDWLFRERYNCATKITAIVRRYLQRCRHFRAMAKIRAQDIAIQKAKRFKLKKLRAKGKKGIIYKELKRVNGFLCLLQMRRKDARNYSQDYGMSFQLYIPMYQLSCTFIIEEHNLRDYIQKALEVDALSIGDLIDKRNLQKIVAQRLVVRGSGRPGLPPRVFFSKQAIGQRGGQILTRGRVIDGDLFVCKLFSTGSEISVQAYHRLSCQLFPVNIRMSTVHEWVRKFYNPEDDVNAPKPRILDPENLMELYKWTIDHLVVDKRRGRYRVLFGCQYEKSRRLEMVIKIQAAVRRALVRPLVIKMLDEFMIKVKPNVHDPGYYYLNCLTGESVWEKPSLLGSRDIPTEPAYRWVPFNYPHDGQYYQHYVNPLTGRYTHFTLDQAARAIQRLARHHLLKLLAVPLSVLTRIVHVTKNAKREYEKNPRRLAAVINYALTAQVVLFDEGLARKLFYEAIELSDSNALVSRAHALFLIASCEPPVKSQRQKAEKKLFDAKNRDESGSKFIFAKAIYSFGCLCQPHNVRSLMNLGLVECLVFGDNLKGERLFRRAVSIEPFDERVVSLWEYVKNRFEEKQFMYYPKSRVELVDRTKGAKKRTIHGRLVAEDPNWAGWCYIEEDVYGVSKQFTDLPYWYNPATGKEQLEVPNFKEEWEVRRNRSVFEEGTVGLEHYFDPLTMAHFQRHVLSNTYQ